ncbi:MAG: NAD(P)/FAD-dependent oxidoreductase [Oscillospiraceae bacterium]
MQVDIAIIGGGPAGLSAAINARARNKTVAVITNDPADSPLWKAERVDNFLGLPGESGKELLEGFRAHAETMEVQILPGKVLTAMAMDDGWMLSVGMDIVEAKAVILAAGVARGQKFPGEEEHLGAGVSYCATCDGMLYRGKTVAVLGYDSGARREAEFLRGMGCNVRYFEKPRHCVIRGAGQLDGITVEGEELTVDGVFILRPTVAPTDLFPGLDTEDGFVSVNRRMETNLPGLFAAGDCTGRPLQLAKATGEGQIAGQSAAAYADLH